MRRGSNRAAALCPLDIGHATRAQRCPLSGVKRTLRPAVLNGAIMVPASGRLPLCVPIPGAALWSNCQHAPERLCGQSS